MLNLLQGDAMKLFIHDWVHIIGAIRCKINDEGAMTLSSLCMCMEETFKADRLNKEQCTIGKSKQILLVFHRCFELLALAHGNLYEQA